MERESTKNYNNLWSGALVYKHISQPELCGFFFASWTSFGAVGMEKNIQNLKTGPMNGLRSCLKGISEQLFVADRTRSSKQHS